MRRRLPPPNWLRSFEAAARHLSFTEAAKELNVSQSAISQQVKLLENFLQQPLFQRYPRRLELTDTGKAYLPNVKEAFERLRVSTEELFGSDRETTLNVRINIAFASLWLAPRIVRFKNQYPKLRMRINNVVWNEDLSCEGIDFDIRFGKGPWPDTESIQLNHDTLFPLCAPDLLQKKPVLSAEQSLAAHTLLTVIGNEDSWPQWLEQAGAQVTAMHPVNTIQFDTSSVAYEAAANGAGFVLGRSLLSQTMLEQQRLIKPFSTEIATDEAYFLVIPSHRDKHPATLAFKYWLLAELNIAS